MVISEANVSQGLLSINTTSGNFDWNALTMIADICLMPTCIGNPTITLNNHGSTLSQSDPETWREHALWLSSFATRYGSDFGTTDFSESVYPGLLDVQEDPDEFGLGGILYLENNNEPDKSWYDNLTTEEYAAGLSAWFFSPEQFALMSSVDYDGHQGQVTAAPLGEPNDDVPIGVHTVNPNVDMVMAALSGLKVNYIQDMVTWFSANRTDPQFLPVVPYEVINVHHYSTVHSAAATEFPGNSDGQINLQGNGVSPEEDGLREKLTSFLNEVVVMHPEMQTKEYWFTEFGYDSHPVSATAALPDRIVGNTGMNARDIDYENANNSVKIELEQITTQAQADWLIRSYFAISAARSDVSGVPNIFFNRATSFDIIDPFEEYVPGLFNSSGLLYGDDSPKKSWFWAMTLRDVLAVHSFADDELVVPSCPDTEIFRYIAPGQPDVYALWDTDSDGIDNMDCSINNILGTTDPSLAVVITFQDGDENGKRQSLPQYINSTPENDAISGNSINGFSVKETPMFIIPGGASDFPPDPILPCPEVVKITHTSCQAGLYRWIEPANNIAEYEIYTLPMPDISAEVALSMGPPAFNLNDVRLRLVVDNISGNSTSATFPISTPSCHLEWVYLVATDVNGVRSEVCGNFVVNKSRCGCSLEIEAGWIEDPTTGDDIASLTDLFELNEVGDLCNLVEGIGGVPTSSWDNFAGDPDEFILDIRESGKTLKLNYIQFFDGSGTGEFKIFGSPLINPLDINSGLDTEVNLVDYIANQFAKWVFVPNNRNIDLEFAQLRFVRSAPSRPNIQKFILCGKLKEPGVMEPPGLVFPEYEKIIEPTITWHNGPIAEVTWNSEYQFYESPETGRVPLYTVAYGTEEDRNEMGEMVYPDFIDVKDDGVSTSFTTFIDDSNLNLSRAIVDVIACYCPLIQTNVGSSFMIQEEVENQLEIYPNPTDDWITFDYEGDGILATYEITNTSGQTVSFETIPKKRKWSVDLTQFPSGVYFVKVTTSRGEIFTEKFILLDKK